MAPKACLGQQREARWPKCVRKWVTIWGSIFNIFQYFLIHFCALFSRLRFGSYFSRCSLNLGVILESFLQLFRASWKCAGKGSRCSPSLSEHYLEAPVFTLFRIFLSHLCPDSCFSHFFLNFGFHFGYHFGANIAKSCHKKSIEKQTCQKVTQDKKGHAGTPPCPPLKEQSQDWQQGQGTGDTPLVPTGTVADLGSIASYITKSDAPHHERVM